MAPAFPLALRCLGSAAPATSALCLWMASVWLRLGGGPATSVRSIRLGFLGLWRFRCERPLHEPWIVLDCLGFPWILSSESRLFNGLRGLKRGKFFLSPFPGVRSAGTGACGRGHAEAQDCSRAKLTLVSDFLQEIVVRVSVADDMSGLGSARSVR